MPPYQQADPAAAEALRATQADLALTGTAASATASAHPSPLPSLADGSFSDNHGDDSYCALCRRCQLRKKLERRLAAKKELSAAGNSMRRELVAASFPGESGASRVLHVPRNRMEPPSSPFDDSMYSPSGRQHPSSFEEHAASDVSPCVEEPSLDEILQYIGESSDKQSSQQRRQRKKRVQRHTRKGTNNDRGDVDLSSSATPEACDRNLGLSAERKLSKSEAASAAMNAPLSVSSSPSSLPQSPVVKPSRYKSDVGTNACPRNKDHQEEPKCKLAATRNLRQSVSATDRGIHSPVSDDVSHHEGQDEESLDSETCLLPHADGSNLEIDWNDQSQYQHDFCGDYEDIGMTPEEREAIDQEVEEFRLRLEAVCPPSPQLRLAACALK